MKDRDLVLIAVLLWLLFRSKAAVPAPAGTTDVNFTVTEPGFEGTTVQDETQSTGYANPLEVHALQINNYLANRKHGFY